MLISSQYRQMNREVHIRDEAFGKFAGKYRFRLRDQLAQRGITEVLDYGAGKGAIKETLGEIAPEVTVYEYDPAVPGKDSLPEPRDAVCCIATMEHIEPECLDDVLDHIHSLGRRMVYFVICTQLSGGHLLPDGRNPHLIVQPFDWWRVELEKRWAIVHSEDRESKNFVAVCEPK